MNTKLVGSSPRQIPSSIKSTMFTMNELFRPCTTRKDSQPTFYRFCYYSSHSTNNSLKDKSIVKSNLNGRCLILSQPPGVSTDILEKTLNSKYLFDENNMYTEVSIMIIKIITANVKWKHLAEVKFDNRKNSKAGGKILFCYFIQYFLFYF